MRSLSNHITESFVNEGLDSPILPIGKMNLKTGKSKYFNVYDEWKEDSTYEIYELNNGSIRVVITSGTKPIAKPDEIRSFKHDQNGRPLFFGKMVDFAVGSQMKNKAAKYGNSISAYVYK